MSALIAFWWSPTEQRTKEALTKAILSSKFLNFSKASSWIVMSGICTSGRGLRTTGDPAIFVWNAQCCIDKYRLFCSQTGVKLPYITVQNIIKN